MHHFRIGMIKIRKYFQPHRIEYRTHTGHTEIQNYRIADCLLQAEHILTIVFPHRFRIELPTLKCIFPAPPTRDNPARISVHVSYEFFGSTNPGRRCSSVKGRLTCQVFQLSFCKTKPSSVVNRSVPRGAAGGIIISVVFRITSHISPRV